METKNQEIIAETLLNPEINLQFPKIHPSNPDQSLIGLRVELNDQIGIVKYVGPVHKEKMKPTDIFLGIEWEDPSRGKHNGTVDGYEYFKTTDNLPSGSLIRATKVNIGNTFAKAIDFKYNFYDTGADDRHKMIDSALESDNYFKANKKIINIELVGKEKAIKEFSQYSKMVCIDLTNCYIKELGNNISSLLPKLRELVLTRTLFTKWSELLDLFNCFPNLTMLNFSENILKFDDEFDNKIQPIVKQEKKMYLETLVLNKCKVDFYTLIRLSPLFISLDKLYLMGNELNFETYNSSPNKEFIDKNISLLEQNTQKLTYLSVERNRIKKFLFVYKMILSPNLHYINMNQNCLTDLLNDNDEEEKKLLEKFTKSITHLSLDYNMFPDNLFMKIFQDIEKLQLKDVDILNNSFVEKNGVEKAKTELIGRNPSMQIMNNTTITKIIRRDYEKYYLKQSVKSYIDLPREEKVTQENFNMKDFEEYMHKNHKQYFVLKTKYFDPLDEFINLLEKKSTNTIKGNMLEVHFLYEKDNKEKKKKFPKSTTIANLRNLCMKLFAMDSNEVFRFYHQKEDKTELIEDETCTLQSFNLTPNDKIVLK